LGLFGSENLKNDFQRLKGKVIFIGKEQEWVSLIGPEQGCQIFLGTLYQHGGKCTKLPQNARDGHKHIK
jgi:hypothetical protein